MKLVLPDAASREVSIENTDEGSKAESVNSNMLGSRSFRGSCTIPVTTLWLASAKSMWFKTFMSESIVLFKRSDNQSRKLNGKIWLERERKFFRYINGSRSFRGSCTIPVTTLCIVNFAERQALKFRLYYFIIYSFNYFLSL
jgi:hypothetical protein